MKISVKIIATAMSALFLLACQDAWDESLELHITYKLIRRIIGYFDSELSNFFLYLEQIQL